MDQVNQELNTSVGQEVSQLPPITVTEVGNLWTTYMTYSLLSRFNPYCVNTTRDKDIKALMVEAEQLATNRVNAIAQMFTKEGRVVPEGFSERDVNVNAPKLFEDTFNIYYLRNLAKINLATNNMFLTTSVRADVRGLYAEFCAGGVDLYQRVTDLMLSKGMLVRSPHVPLVNQIDFVKEQSFLDGFLGEKRPLLALEISSLHFLSLTNFIGKALLLGFRQVAQAEAIRDYMDRGVKLANKIITTYSSFLERENIPQPMYWDSMVTDSTVSPFSDKFMLYHVNVLNAAGFLNIGAALSTSLRHDVSASYMKTLVDIANFAEDGTNLMIANGWMEEPPRHVDRSELSQLH